MGSTQNQVKQKMPPYNSEKQAHPIFFHFNICENARED